jgi:hypothetical protein
VLSYDEARSQISDAVAEEKRRGELQRYIERLRSQAIIQWRNEELKKAYDQALAARQKQLGETAETRTPKPGA